MTPLYEKSILPTLATIVFMSRFVYLPSVFNDAAFADDIDFDFARVFHFLLYAPSDILGHFFCVKVAYDFSIPGNELAMASRSPNRLR